MSKKDPWNQGRIEDAYMEITFVNWRTYVNFIIDCFLNTEEYIFRGQRDSEWDLVSRLDRQLRDIEKLDDDEIRKIHLENFKHAVRGRRGPHPQTISEENDWWALGQHHGLSTPLLDWTESPFVALYFAFENAGPKDVKFSSVYALAEKAVKRKIKEIERGYYSRKAKEELRSFENTTIDFAEQVSRDLEKPPSTVHMIRPLLDENSRLISQQGLFTRIPDGITLESWIEKCFKDEKERAYLIQFLIPNVDREDCLKSLNRMTINQRAMFPDLEGAASYCDTKLLIDNY